MSSKYSRPFSIPPELAPVLTNLTRSILRTSSYSSQLKTEADICAFSYSHFMEELAKLEESSSPDAGEGGTLSTEELVGKVEVLFANADVDGNGVLDRKEFKDVFNSLKEELGLSNKIIKQLMSEADEDDDGLISYREFLPLAVDVLSTLEAKDMYEGDVAAAASFAVDDAKDFLLHGMPREQLEMMLKGAFTKADKDNSGYLDRKEFKTCLKSSGLGFTKKEINVMMSEVDLDGDGKITYDEFVPICFEMLSEMMADKMRGSQSQTEEELKNYVLDCLDEEVKLSTNEEGSTSVPEGHVNKKTASNALISADLGLSRIQLAGIMSAATADKKGNVSVEKLASAAAAVLVNLNNIEMQRRMADDLAARNQSEEQYLILGMDQETMRATLDASFREADVEGTGLLTEDVISDIVCEKLGDIDQQMYYAIMSLAIPDDEYNVWYDDVAEWAFASLEGLAMEYPPRY